MLPARFRHSLFFSRVYEEEEPLIHNPHRLFLDDDDYSDDFNDNTRISFHGQYDNRNRNRYKLYLVHPV